MAMTTIAGTIQTQMAAAVQQMMAAGGMGTSGQQPTTRQRLLESKNFQTPVAFDDVESKFADWSFQLSW
jgi:hypothetical protein